MKRQKNVCYFCGSEATTREHAPPKLLFKGFECDSITVPSCIDHNCSKSGEDQAIVYALLSPLKNYLRSNVKNKIKLTRDIKRAIKKAESSFKRTKRNVINTPFLEKTPGTVQRIPDVSFLKKPMNISNWIKNLTAAIIYDGVQYFDSNIKWSNIKCWSAEYLSSKVSKTDNDKINLLVQHKEVKKSFEDKYWIEGWSAYPRKYPKNIYCFYLCIEDKEVTIKHHFYNSYDWYCWFKLSNTTLNKIKEKVKSGKFIIN